MRVVLGLAIVAAVAGGSAVPPVSGGTVAAGTDGFATPVVVRYQAPVWPLRVVRGFSPPATAYGPGHLGVDLSAAQAEAVLAAGDGVVTFAGMLAGRGVVVVGHPDGIRTEYEPVRPTVRVGAPVRAGDPLGVLQGRHRGCTRSCLHWGARRGAAYLDPLSLLRPLGPVRLLPWDRPV